MIRNSEEYLNAATCPEYEKREQCLLGFVVLPTDIDVEMNITFYPKYSSVYMVSILLKKCFLGKLSYSSNNNTTTDTFTLDIRPIISGY